MQDTKYVEDRFLELIKKYKINLAHHVPPGGIEYWRAWQGDDASYEAGETPEDAVTRLINRKYTKKGG